MMSAQNRFSSAPRRSRRQGRNRNPTTGATSAVSMTRTIRSSADTVFLFNRRCWDITTSNSGGSFSVHLPPDASLGASAFLTFGTPATDIGATNYIPFCLDLLPDTDLSDFNAIRTFFREYQVRGVNVTISALNSDVWSASTGCALPEVISAIDPTAAVPPAGPSTVLAFENCRTRTISQEHSMSIKCAPRLSIGAETLGTPAIQPAVYNDRTNDFWVDTQIAAAPAYSGITGVIRNYATNAGASPSLRMTCQVVIAARRPQ
jgi:hypothetical protein